MSELTPERQSYRDQWIDRIKAMIARRTVAICEIVGEKTEPYGFEEDDSWAD